MAYWPTATLQNYSFFEKEAAKPSKAVQRRSHRKNIGRLWTPKRQRVDDAGRLGSPSRPARFDDRERADCRPRPVQKNRPTAQSRARSETLAELAVTCPPLVPPRSDPVSAPQCDKLLRLAAGAYCGSPGRAYSQLRCRPRADHRRRRLRVRTFPTANCAASSSPARLIQIRRSRVTISSATRFLIQVSDSL
jgi:hypothetical protein